MSVVIPKPLPNRRLSLSVISHLSRLSATRSRSRGSLKTRSRLPHRALDGRNSVPGKVTLFAPFQHRFKPSSSRGLARGRPGTRPQHRAGPEQLLEFTPPACDHLVVDNDV